MATPPESGPNFSGARQPELLDLPWYAVQTSDLQPLSTEELRRVPTVLSDLVENLKLESPGHVKYRGGGVYPGEYLQLHLPLRDVTPSSDEDGYWRFYVATPGQVVEINAERMVQQPRGKLLGKEVVEYFMDTDKTVRRITQGSLRDVLKPRGPDLTLEEFDVYLKGVLYEGRQRLTAYEHPQIGEKEMRSFANFITSPHVKSGTAWEAGWGNNEAL